MSEHRVNNIDTNIQNNILAELMAIAELQELEPKEIVLKTNSYINKFKDSDPILSAFFIELQSQLLSYAQGLMPPEHPINEYNEYIESDDDQEGENNNEVTGYNNNNGNLNRNEYKYSVNSDDADDYDNGDNGADDYDNGADDGDDEYEDEDEDNNPSDDKDGRKEGFENRLSNDAYNPSNQQQQSNWDTNEYLEQDDKNQSDKITNRQQKTQTFGNNHAPMKQEQIATTDTYNLAVKQDSLNPNLKNVMTRYVNIDSQFRKYTNGSNTSTTDYTLDLSDTLKNLLSLTLFSFQIPFSWYCFDKYYGNTCFWIVDLSYNIPIVIPSGNYTSATFTTQLKESFEAVGFDLSTVIIPSDAPSGATAPIYINPSNGKVTLYINGITYNPTKTSPLFTVSSETIILFYDFTGQLICENNCYSKTSYFFNSTLGWMMGYRLPYINVEENGNPAPSIIDLIGTKYLILVIDDYNKNRIGNNMVSISKFNNTLSMPNYYTNDLVYSCAETTSGETNNLQDLINETKTNSLLEFQTTNPLNGLIIGGKYEQSFSKTQGIVPSAPRQLTKSQIHTINEIIKNKNNSSMNYLTSAPTSGNVFATLPVKPTLGLTTGNLLVEFSGSIQSFKRTYFGPVDVDRMAIRILNDKGQLLNLNGNDWSVTLLAECLYQY